MSKTEPSRRVSLTTVQRQTAAGLELIAICQAVTADGRLSDSELEDLRGWVDAYPDSALAAHAHLKDILQHILADGIVTPAEQRELYAALERILPPDVRADVSARRKAADGAAQRRNRPIDGWDFMVAGCRYEGRGGIIAARCTPGDPVVLQRDIGNPYSRNAIEVRIAGGDQIGYVPETDAVAMAALMDSRHRYRARIKKVLSGGRSPIPVVVVDFFSNDTELPDLTRPSEALSEALSGGAARKGCATLLATCASIAAVIAISFFYA